MKFDDIVFMIQLGTSALAAASANPVLIAGVSGANRLIKIGQDAYANGQERGEWTGEEAARFDNVVLPTITAQAHWMK